MSSNRPIIIKKKRKGGGDHGHHGGAWKVAYADFVTAMMAFFMLMWLLNATTEQQRKGLADYFAPTVPLSPVSGGGHGPFGGDDVMTEEVLVANGQGASLRMPGESKQANGSTGVDRSDEARNEDAAFETVDARLVGRSGESFVSDLDARHVVTRITDEGLVVELFDLPGAPLIDGDTPTETLLRILGAISGAFKLVDNAIEVRGHVAARPIVALGPSPWETTAERSDLVRAELGAAGTDEARFRRLAGHGDRQPAVPDPMAARNSRIEVVLLRNET